jgi:hypothetical protein
MQCDLKPQILPQDSYVRHLSVGVILILRLVNPRCLFKSLHKCVRMFIVV